MSAVLTRNQLTPESKALLRKTVRGLRESLIAELKESAEQRYLLSLPATKAATTLDAASSERRRRLEAALDQAAQEGGGGKEARARAFEAAAKEAGATLLNRLVLLRHLEALGLSKPAVLTGGWMSKGYQEFQQVAPALCEDETQGMAPLLELLFAELAVALPGLFGDVGLTGLFKVPPSTLRHVIEALDQVPTEAWCDDLTLGWVYQFWNDPDREALDAKLNASGKIEPHEIASKTQMFTERYMVEWLLQNSLGPTWLAICKKHGWVPEVESTEVLAQLDARRAEWRQKREAGAVAPDALMPVNGPVEEAWKYYVPQPMPAPVIEHAPDSIRELKLLDPACGSGHFLVVAFDLLAELYREEARHRRESWSDRQIAEWILENNLHGVDIDPRAVQIAAAALYLKARALAKDAEPHQVNLVAPLLKLSALAQNDVGLVKLETDIQTETGIPPELTRQLIAVLEGVDHLGTLLRLGDAIDKAIAAHAGVFATTGRQKELFGGGSPTMPLDRVAAKLRVEDLLSRFLAAHASAEDLGLRLRGQQLTAGLRFASIAKEGEYHLVVGNPPYQGTSKMRDAKYIAKNYPMGKSDLYAAFLERGLNFCRLGGASAMVTMRSWMFLSAYASLRSFVLGSCSLRAIGDVGTGAFSERSMDDIISASLVVIRKCSPEGSPSVAIQAAPLRDATRDAGKPFRRSAALLAQEGRFSFLPGDFKPVEGQPLVYWWTPALLAQYSATPKIGSLARVRFGLNSGDNARFTRFWWEIERSRLTLRKPSEPVPDVVDWAPLVMGGKGRAWFEELRNVIKFEAGALELKLSVAFHYGDAGIRWKICNEDCYFQPGVAFSMIGTDFKARAHRFRSVIDAKGSSVFPRMEDAPRFVCSMNSALARSVLASLNPTLSFQVGDVQRLPLFPVSEEAAIWERMSREFDSREGARETSVEFKQPQASSWEAAQQWAEAAVDRPLHAALPDFRPAPVPPSIAERLSFAVGVALGRFDPSGSGLLEHAPRESLADGILFVASSGGDYGAQQQASDALTQAWRDWGPGAQRSRVGEWLIEEFFAHHRSAYANRPIYFPLSSAKRSFVVFVLIHRWDSTTLTKVLANHLVPEKKALEGSMADLRAARASSDKKARSENDRRFAQQAKWLEELEDFIARVTECAEKGPPPPDSSTPAREVDAPYVMDLDDGVMVNAAALWPLLEPMWKDPKKWWKELAAAKGRKDYDWSHLSARYFPSRVDEKCQKDPSLAAAHGCLWKYHPAVAYQWELRLQDEMGAEFRISEKDSDSRRTAFLKKEPGRVSELQAAEQLRRERKANRQDQEDLEFEATEDTDDDGEAA